MDLAIKQLEPRTTTLLLLALPLLVMSALGSYVIWPELREYRAALATRNILNGVSQNDSALGAQITALQQQVESLGHELHGDLAGMPDNQVEAFIIGRLQAISWRNNIQLQSVVPGKGTPVKVFEEVVFKVGITGDYFDLHAWLRDLDDELGFVVVKHFSIKPANSGGKQQTLRADLTVALYRQAAHV